MSDLNRKYTKKSTVPTKKVATKPKPLILPTQNGPRDTRNWDTKVYKAPDGKKIIETEQRRNGINISE